MKNISLAAVYLGFFAMIGYACYITKSAGPLLALIVMPNFSILKENKSEA
jgi:hypothetical protein